MWPDDHQDADSEANRESPAKAAIGQFRELCQMTARGRFGSQGDPW